MITTEDSSRQIADGGVQEFRRPDSSTTCSRSWRCWCRPTNSEPASPRRCTHAETSRTKRRQAAEERAGKIGVKLVFPLVLFLFPALYIVILGPAVISFVPSVREVSK
jgi:hypothetical protein